ncbi:MAG: sulfurtransferase [Verrucomicrobiae bacterium]|nr:sulfurtransferase [Verrucomicrobiae bacterium]
MPVITNIAAYQFATLADLKPLRERLLAQCKAWKLKGTILLSPEGINLFVAGEKMPIEQLLTLLRAIPGLEKLTPKYSESDHQPFTRMLVRLKKEIIAFGVQSINPAQHTSPKLSAQTLKQWLDEGKPITLLDTRNDYEVKLGTFKGARSLDLDHFRNFPQAVQKSLTDLKNDKEQKPIVMFCTGGIRCEKAGAFMEREGFSNIYQLDGGILKYFEECGGEHYEGECFVFDQRVGVDPALRETESIQCYVCQAPLNPNDQKDERFIPGKSCPYCFAATQEQKTKVLAKRHEAIRHATTPLPGSQPYENHRPLMISSAHDGKTLLDCYCDIFSHISREEWSQRFTKNLFQNENGYLVTSNHVVKTGEKYIQIFPENTEPDINPNIEILHEDEAILVINKPAPLPVHPSGRFNRNTLQYILHQAYAPQKPQPAHRLDANTTGLIVCTRTRHFAKLLQPQFERGKVEKTYLARVQGQPAKEFFICEAPISFEPTQLGARIIDESHGLPARTEFKVLQRFPNKTTLIEVKPITGRTNQIRLHLWHMGFPICGDPTYLPNQKLGEIQTLTINDPPLCLHAWKISFNHPLHNNRVVFETPLPNWPSRISNCVMEINFQ